MGVTGLWPLLEPAQSLTTLTALSLSKFDTPSCGFRLGIDASIWFFHAEYGKEGENPQLRTLFFRCAQLLSQGFLPLFVFDGPLRPGVKRGKRISKSSNKLETGMKAIIEAFGFEYRKAPGEAEAELAFLNRIGVIDGILSDDVDNFLFGANVVVRNHSSTHAGAKSVIEKAKVYAYNLPHPACNLDREDLIFIAMCSGGDYGKGVPGCGIKTSYGLARAGFGKSLCQAAINHGDESPQLKGLIRQWKVQLTQELKTNASGFLPHKSPKLACTVPEEFPEMKILRAYLTPVTSETLGRSEFYNDFMVNNGGRDGWLKKDPSLPRLAEICEFYFEWGFMDSIIKRFRTLTFHGVALRIMRRAFLLCQSQFFDTSMISLDHIRSHFCSDNYTLPDGDVPCPAFITNISKTRTHESTSKTLEYRVAVNPTILVQLTASGVKGVRRPDDDNEWAEFEDEFAADTNSDEGGSKGKSKKKEYPDPMLPLKLWLPAVLVKAAVPGVVEAYEDVLRRKEEKKTGKGKKTKATGQEPKAKLPRKLNTNAQTAVSVGDEPKLGDAVKRKTKARAMYWPAAKASSASAASGHDSSDEDLDYDGQFLRFTAPVAPQKTPSRSLSNLSSSTNKAGTSSPAKIRKTLSGNFSMISSSSIARKDNVKSHFNASKPSGYGKGKSKALIPHADGSLLSLIDEIGTKKKKDRKRDSIPNVSSPAKFTPFPVSREDSDDNPFDDHHSPPPQTPSPQKKSRKANAITMSSSEDESSSRKSKASILNKSPRKSKEHTYPKGLSGDRDETRKTIRDIQHPSRLRAASPTPLRRTPLISASAPSRNGSMLQPSSNASAPPSRPIFIISDSEEEKDNAPLPPPEFIPDPTKAKPKSKFLSAHSKASQVQRGSATEAPCKFVTGVGHDDDDDDIPPSLRARASAKAHQTVISKHAVKAKMSTKLAVDVIELSD